MLSVQTCCLWSIRPHLRRPWKKTTVVGIFFGTKVLLNTSRSIPIHSVYWFTSKSIFGSFPEISPSRGTKPPIIYLCFPLKKPRHSSIPPLHILWTVSGSYSMSGPRTSQGRQAVRPRKVNKSVVLNFAIFRHNVKRNPMILLGEPLNESIRFSKSFTTLWIMADVDKL